MGLEIFITVQVWDWKVHSSYDFSAPRIEVTATLSSAKVSKILKQDLDPGIISNVIWTVSHVGPACIKNDTR